MPLIPKKGLLTIAAMIDVGLNQASRPISAQTLALRYGSSPRRLEPVLQALVHSGILRGVRGPHGGYTLTRDPASITIGEILRAAVPKGGVPLDTEEDGEIDDPLVREVVNPALDAARNAFAAALDTVTLQTLMNRAKEVEPPLPGPEAKG